MSKKAPELKAQPDRADQARTLRLQALALLQAAEEIDGVFVSAKNIGIDNNADQPFGIPVAVLAIIKGEEHEVYVNLPDNLVRVHTFDCDFFDDCRGDPDMLDMVEPLPADVAALAPPEYKLPVEIDPEPASDAPRG